MADANRKCEALGLGSRVFTSGYTAETGNKEELSLAMDGSVWVKLDSRYVNVTELNGDAGIKGTLTVGSNCCTKEIVVHPLQHCNLALTLDDRDRNPENHIASSLIMFNKNQTWTAYFAWFEDVQEWNVERDCICLRLSDREFSKIFGKYRILQHSERKNDTKKQDEKKVNKTT